MQLGIRSLALVIAALTVALLVVSAVALVWWVYTDLTARGSGFALPVAVGCALFPPLAFLYLPLRGRAGPREEQSRRQRLVGTLGYGVVFGLVVSVLLAPDAVTQILLLPVGIALGLPLAYVLLGRPAGRTPTASA